MPYRPFVSTEIKGYQELIRKLQGDPLHARAWRRALYDILRESKKLAQARAPKGTGRLAKRNRYRLQKGKVPLWGILSNSASRKGFRYGFALDAGHARRRGGREYQFHRRGGGSTKGWFKGILGEIGGFVNQRMRKAAQDIEADWK